jgi:hypothetical protein
MLRRTTAVASVVALVFAATAFAGNGGPSKSSSSISLVVLTTASGTSGPRYGGQVTFNVSTTATAYPYVNVKCFQNGVLVGQGWAGFFAGALGTETFTLASPKWTGGAADCTAWLDMYASGKWKQLASTSFHVSA